MAPSDALEAGDLGLLRIEQAKLLKKRVVGSCLIVEFIIAYTAIVMALMNSAVAALVWFALGSAMVLVTFAYARLMAREGITEANYQRYLLGHCIISALTGAVWGAVAIFQIDYSSEFTVFIGTLIVGSITLGGIIPSSAYRPTYIALASTSLPPLGLYLAFTAPNALRFVGIGMLVYFFFVMTVSARVELDTRETIAARNARRLNEMISAKNRLFLEMNEEKSRFLNFMVHDMSQPLQSQRFFLHALRELLTTPLQRRLFAQVEEAWRAQRDLVRGLVDVAQIDSGALLMRPVSLSLDSECSRLAAEFAPHEGEDRPVLETDFQPVPVRTDPALLARILRNLVGNAMRYTPAGGTVRFSLRDDGENARIVIADTGPGIADADCERMFEEFSRGDKNETAGGANMGLGLSIVRRLSDLLDIELALQTGAGEGCTFTLTIPKNGPSQPAPADAPGGWGQLEGSPLIVVVDDMEDVLASMSVVLTGWGCKVVSARSRSLAVEALGHVRAAPSLLIVDLQLGEDDGLETIASLREECNFDIPAVLMGGNLAGAKEEAMRQRILCLDKPVDPQDIRLILEGGMNTMPEPTPA
ncbi:MAG: response regulator [Erythrobacter sp.]|nr:response regulator [Erythrobacter sp.]NCQ64264.1 response regulator [Alphaproteobacteria bacterium]